MPHGGRLSKTVASDFYFVAAVTLTAEPCLRDLSSTVTLSYGATSAGRRRTSGSQELTLTMRSQLQSFLADLTSV